MGRRTMQISSPVRVVGRQQKHVIGTSMGFKSRGPSHRPANASQDEYSIFNPVMCPAVVCWLKDPVPTGNDVENIVIAPAISKDMSHRSLQGETDFHDAETDFRMDVDQPPAAQWKEIHTDISTHTPEFEQMHPHPLRSTSPKDNYGERNSFLTPERTPNPSVTNSPQHPSMWSSPRHRMATESRNSNLAPLNLPSPSPPKNFGWLTPARSGVQVPDPVSPDFGRATQHQRDPLMSPSHHKLSQQQNGNMSPSSSKLWQHQNGSMPPRPSSAAKEKVDKTEKSLGKGWKNLSRSISPMFAGRKAEGGSTFKAISRDLGASFQGSRRRGHVKSTTPTSNWSGESSVVTSELEKEGSGGGSQMGYSSELTRSGSTKSTTSGSNGVLSFLSWGRKKSNGAKINELCQVVDQGSVKLDSNSFKVMEYTIKTLHYKLEQAKKNELTTAEEFKALQTAMDAAEGKCQQWQHRCQELESQLDQEMAKHKRVNSGMGAAPQLKAHRFTTLEVTPAMFQKALDDSKLSIKKLASALCIHIRESGESATQVIVSLLEQQKETPREVSKMPRNVIVLYFEAFLNQVMYESFENVSFEPNGATTIYDPDALRSSCCKAYSELKKQEWATIEKSLSKSGSTIVNQTFHRFFVIRMELILSQLTKVADKETSLALLATFFNAFKSVWLLHHLAFANEIPVTIFRCPSGSDFDPRFMEQVTTYEEEPSRSKISVMVNPGFIVNRQTIKCQVFCSSKYQ